MKKFYVDGLLLSASYLFVGYEECDKDFPSSRYFI